MDYEVETLDKRKENNIFHVNLLKKWKEREEGCYLSEDLGPQPTGEEGERAEVILNEDLDVGQRKDIRALEQKYQRTFSKKPGQTNLVEHTIRLKGNQVIRSSSP